MPNAIKYNTSVETLALKKGNFYIGTGDVGKGPTSSTGYYNGITPPSGGYTIYLNKASGGPSIYTVNTEAQLTGLTSTIAGQTFTTSGQCLNWFATQTDKMIFNIDYPAIVTNGLLLNLDAGFTPSYSQSGTTWYGVGASGYTGTLTNGPTFDSSNGGSIVFDGTDDTLPLSSNPIYQLYSANTVNQSWTISMWLNILPKSRQSITTYGNQIGVELLITAFSDTAVPLMWTDGSDYLYGNTTVVNKGWCNLVFQFDGNNTRKIWNIYLNGVLDATYTKTISNANYPLLGSSLTLSSNPINGKLSQFLIYSRVLSQSEISQNYEAIGTRYTSLSVQSLVVAGGGSGGGYGYPSGGGGAGGLLTGYTTNLSLNTNYTITVGAGGSSNSNGSNSVFNTSTSIGGGRGGNGRSASGVSGGSGGGGGSNYPADLPSPYLTPAGSGTAGQGNDGGVGKSVYGDTSLNGVPTGAGGGGGAGAVGGTGTITPSIKAGDGGVGRYFSEYSTIGGYPSGWFAGGGGGSTSYSSTETNAVGVGGNGGGGNGSYTQFSSGPSAIDGIVNTGGGGGGAGYIENSSANGGSGIVILRIPDVYTARFSSGVTSSVTKSGGYKYYKVTATSTTSETVSFS
jgi:hypothetical protein